LIELRFAVMQAYKMEVDASLKYTDAGTELASRIEFERDEQAKVKPTTKQVKAVRDVVKAAVVAPVDDPFEDTPKASAKSRNARYAEVGAMLAVRREVSDK
jgi:hypothetical protein